MIKIKVKMQTMLLVMVGLLATIGVEYVMAECPNGCSGNGDCQRKDMCECYKNYQGNDCADHTCLFGQAHVDTPKGDINMDQLRNTPNWILTNSQRDPAQTYEYFHPEAVTNEAHFYMECSNKGICDRSTGLCECFNGYEGNGCQRTTCQSKCSDHGTCESLRELGAKASGTLFGAVEPAGAVIYDLWDANSTYGCRCDPWFFAPDCSKRNCKVGIDPLYLSVGTALVETFVIHAYVSKAVALTPPVTSAWIRLRVFDYYGESYITSPIPFVDDTDAPASQGAKDNAAAVEAALLAVPNLTFRDVVCEPTGASGVGTELGDYKSLKINSVNWGMSVTCQYVDNPGKMRIPEVVAFDFVGNTVDTRSVFVVTTAQQGQDDEWFTTQSSMTVASATSTVLTLGPTDVLTDFTWIPSATSPILVKVGSHIVAIKTKTAGTPPTLSMLYTSTLTGLAGESVFLMTPPSTFSLAVMATTLAVAVAVGDDYLQFGTHDPLAVLPTPEIPTGSMIFFHNAFYTIGEHWKDGTNFFARINKPFSGNADTGGPAAIGDPVFMVTAPSDVSKTYNYVSECSGRGMCNYETGVCSCFKGYTNDNCNTQNILAL